jgi:hypothetical protein
VFSFFLWLISPGGRVPCLVGPSPVEVDVAHLAPSDRRCCYHMDKHAYSRAESDDLGCLPVGEHALVWCGGTTQWVVSLPA